MENPPALAYRPFSDLVQGAGLADSAFAQLKNVCVGGQYFEQIVGVAGFLVVWRDEGQILFQKIGKKAAFAVRLNLGKAGAVGTMVLPLR